jgi:hypothetical protein
MDQQEYVATVEISVTMQLPPNASSRELEPEARIENPHS